MEELKDKLFNEFNVKLTNPSRKIKQDPTMILEFPAEVTQKLNLLLSEPGRINLSYFTAKATSFAKSTEDVPPFVAEPKVALLSQNPYKIQIQGSYPLVYLFVACILTEQ